ncbi:hypothetical protein [Nocardioides zeae]
MSVQAVERVAVGAFTYETLDDWSEQVAVTVLAYWYLRPTMPDVEWIDLVVDSLVTLLVRAEYVARIYGLGAEPVDGDPIFPAMPTTPYPRPPGEWGQRNGMAPEPGEFDPARRLDEVRPSIERAVLTLAEEIDKPSTIEAARGQDVSRVDRMARDEAVSSMQRGYQDGIRTKRPGRPEVRGYRRGVNPDCCRLCFYTWKEGYVYPIAQPMWRHTGCRCWPIPTTDRVKGDLDAAGRALLARYYDDRIEETTHRSDR